jgi:hypothetical protein
MLLICWTDITVVDVEFITPISAIKLELIECHRVSVHCSMLGGRANRQGPAYVTVVSLRIELLTRGFLATPTCRAQWTLGRHICDRG